MNKEFYKYRYDGKMDEEVIPLCDALNSLIGITTIESCCGHGKETFTIFFRVQNYKQGLFFLTRCADPRYWEYGNDWSLTLRVGDIPYEDNEDNLPIVYLLESKVMGDEAYKQAESLLENMVYHLNHSNFINLFNLDNVLK
jgi:hypothetical protein